MATTVLRAVIRKQAVHAHSCNHSHSHIQNRLLPRVHKRQHGSSSNPSDRTKENNIPIPVANTVGQVPFWQRLGPLTRAAESYARAQRRRPWTTQIASALGIYLCADLTAQYMGDSDAYSPQRTVRSLIIGGVAAIPNWEWYVFLSHHFNYASRWLSIGTKVAVNLAVFTPTFNVYFFASQALLSGETIAATIERCKATVPVSFVNAVKVWPAATALSFAFVPLEYRSIFAGVIAVGWQTYLSWVNRQAEMREEHEHELHPVAVAEARQQQIDVPQQQRQLATT